MSAISVPIPLVDTDPLMYSAGQMHSAFRYSSIGINGFTYREWVELGGKSYMWSAPIFRAYIK